MNRIEASLVAAGWEPPTLWGMSPVELHDRLWQGAGVEVVRPGAEVSGGSAVATYLLVGKHELVAFVHGGKVMRLLERQGGGLVRLTGVVIGPTPDRVVLDRNGRFDRIERRYGVRRAHHGRCLITRDGELARQWARNGYCVRRLVGRRAAKAVGVYGGRFDGNSRVELEAFTKLAQFCWHRPPTRVRVAPDSEAGLWISESSQISDAVTKVGPLWVGDGWSFEDGRVLVLGPAVIWDRMASERGDVIPERRWGEGPFGDVSHFAASRIEPRRVIGKRIFDVMFAAVALLFTLPFYLLICLAILIEDGRPFLYAQWREGLSGRPFRCWKFRSMRKDADRIKRELAVQNQADGPQFFIRKDPRVTRVGRVLRRLNVDEWPQFWNVLRGEMSVVGPRPSPKRENQFCPAWRETRLSVRPGITGLWQVKRSRRAGSDFQEWIKFDVEYVERSGWAMDLLILLKTLRLLLPSRAEQS